jgi:hypothetical protein
VTYIRMTDFRPPARDDQPWESMEIQESGDGVSALATIEVKSLITGPGLAPLGLDTTPRYPVARDWTTELATLSPGQGYYRVRFTDSEDNASDWSDWVRSGLEAWVPTLRDVAVHIRNRTVERSTNKFAGTFTDKTRPTDEEAWEAITIALDDIESDTGRLDRAGIGPVSWKAVRTLAALRAAMIIERSYFSEQIGSNKSPYPGLERDWERRLPKVVDAVAEDIAGEVEPTVDYGTGDGGGGVIPTPNPTVSNDLIVPSGMNIYTKEGRWVRESALPQHNFPDQPGAVDWSTKF